MNLEFLKDLVAGYNEKEQKLERSLVEAENIEERKAINEALVELRKEKATAIAQLDAATKVDTKQLRKGQESENVLASMEYRTAFMEFVKNGTRSEILMRANDQNESTDLGVLLPETIVQEIMTQLKGVYGTLYSRVKHLNIKGGVKFPIGEFGAKFTRIGENGAPTDRQNGGQVTGYVEFSYNIGEIRLAKTLLADVLSVPAFESELAKVIVETYLAAMDNEILNGVSASMECEGILTELAKPSSRIKANHVIEFTAEEFADWTQVQKKLFAKIPLSMRKLRPEFLMTANTWESNVVTLKDQNDRPLAREVFDANTGDEICRFKGREVILIEEGLGIQNFDDAANGEVFGFYWIPEKAYAINSNLQFSVKKYFDEEKLQYVTRAVVINDGKILDDQYLYVLKKKVA